MIGLRSCACVALALCVTVIACTPPSSAEEASEEEESAPVAATCAAARTESLADHVTLRGILRPPPEREGVVVPAVPGRVRELRVHEGDQVTQGQWLATIEDPGLSEAVVASQSEVAAVQARREAARAAYARAERLFGQGIAARREVEEAHAALAGVEAEASTAQARVGLAGAQRARARVTAPMAGVVVRVHRNVGDMVSGGSDTPLLELADTSQLELRADAPANVVVRAQPGMPVSVRLEAFGGQTFAGRVRGVAPAVDPRSGLGVLYVAVEPAGATLRLGLAGEGELVLGAMKPTVLVPASAVRRSATGRDELVICTGDTNQRVAEAREVVLGERVREDVVIASGLLAGELVVIDHALGLETGTKLRAEGAPR